MKTLISFLVALCLWSMAFACSWSPESFCQSLNSFDFNYPSYIIVSGVVTSVDDDGADLEVVEVLRGTETRTTIRIWDGSDFDCNGLVSLAAEEYLNEGDAVVIALPEVVDIENPWDQIGDYRVPIEWIHWSILHVENGEIFGYIFGSAWLNGSVDRMGYNYFIETFAGSGACDFDSPNLNIRFFHDRDGDGMKRYDENNLPVGSISLNNEQVFLNTKTSGIDIYASDGSYNITFNESLTPNWTTTASANFDFEIIDGEGKFYHIGLKPTNGFSNMSLNVINSRFRCGEEVDFVLVAKNEGTVTDSGIAWLELDSELEAYDFSKQPDYTTDEGIVGWDYEDLEPYEIFTVGFLIRAPIVEDEDQLNNIYVIKAYADDTQNRTVTDFCQEVELRCSYDPNDKRVFPLREDNLALIDKPLRYIIRFQNKGNDYAKDVVVRDTLDSNLDRSSFKLIDTSHPDDLTISSDDGYALSFDFNNIFLAASMTNEPASHGHITYEIAVKENLVRETEINNTAHIYFDFNPAIVTNTTKSIMVDAFPLSMVTEPEDILVNFYPNPASDLIYFDQLIDKVRLYNLSGQLVLQEAKIWKLSLDRTLEGLHIMEMDINGQQVRKKIMVTK